MSSGLRVLRAFFHMHFKRSGFGVPALLLTLAVSSSTALAQPVTLSLKDADIGGLITLVSKVTGKNFVVDPRVKGRVSVISSKPMDEEEVYEVFLSILAVHGFAAIPSGSVIKIIPEAASKQLSIPTIGGEGVDAQDQMVTRVIQVQNVTASQIVPILRPLIPPQGHLAAYSPTNVLIISDRAANVERIANIISRVDRASNEEVEIVALRHASATEVVRVLNSLEQGHSITPKQQGAITVSSPARMVADERTNSILMSGDQPSRLRMRALISHLDTPLPNEGNTQVVYLRYAKAVDLVNVLSGVRAKLESDEQTDAKAAQVAAGAPASVIDIQADETTNALVITAPPEALRSIKGVIAQLDVRRAQVLVEAIIAEVSAEKSAQLGVQWVISGNFAAGLTNFDGASSLLGIAAAVDSNTVPTTLPNGTLLAVGDTRGSAQFGALVNALASDADTNVLSTPTIVTLDNEEAEIKVGQNVPFVTGSFTTNGDDSSNPFQTIERQDVGLTLRVKPQINEGNAVQLEIYQEVSSVVPTANLASQGPTTQQRTLSTTVLVEDNQILVLGGLIDDNLSESVSKVPILGDIPLLGNLFRSRETSITKRNLMIFLHPVILRDGVQGNVYSNSKYNFIREAQIQARQGGVALMPEVRTPMLQPREQVELQKSVLPINPEPISVPVNKPEEKVKRVTHGFKDK